jgi:thymidylate synthase
MSNQEEQQYLQQLSNIINLGYVSNDRTNMGTKSLFGSQMRFNLENNSFPLLTTKKMFIKGIIEELLWFLKGDTNSKNLENKGVSIWKGNSSRETLNKLGFTNRVEGDCGPIYGHNFRHYGGKYIDCDTNYTNSGYDQVKNVLHMLKEDPTSRRIIINLWDPLSLNDTVLPACHVLYQFKVIGNKLSCSLYQRSGDMGLGVPFNIASASLLTIIFAKLSGLEPYELIHTIGDSHIYLDHEQQLTEQILRVPFEFPKIKITNRFQTKVEDFNFEDFIVYDYKHHDKIKLNMSI